MAGRLTILICMIIASAAYATPVVIQPGPDGKDTYIKINDDTPKGDDVELHVKRGIGGTGLLTCRTFIEFDVSAYSGIDVAKAEIHLWSVYPDTLENAIVAKQVGSSWNEGTLIWDNRPGFSGGDYEMVEAEDYYYIDVTNLAYQWITLGIPNNGVCIKFKDESVPNDGIVFHSSDNTEYPDKRPALLIWSPDLAVEPTSFGAVKATFM
ncbi:MAG: DNRLRE domain-containing protein [Candidatus Coatesbacteria bacterium]|nr:MAG: DNRLRE domain-containing protein [Candidatus Coatesbacteria bacterium]